MDKVLSVHSRASGQAPETTLAEGVRWGLLGGLAGTMVMDLCVIGAFSAADVSVLHCFSNIGDTVARFFTIFGMEIPGGVPVGIATQYLIGPAIGASFGAAVAWVDILRAFARKRAIVLAVLYVEMVGQPLIATMPILLRWTLPEALTWYGGALIAHLIAGAVLGLVMRFGLRPTCGTQRPSSKRNSITGSQNVPC